MIALINLENELWTPEVGPDINDPAATAYSIVHTPAGLVLLMNSVVPYGGWLAKQVSPLLFPAKHITMFFDLMIDDATPYTAQVIETDAKITDEEGWTYDLSAQFNLAKGWMFEVDEVNANGNWSWVSTGIQVKPLRPLRPAEVEIAYELDYEAHTSSILSVTIDEDVYEVDPRFHGLTAMQVGWQKKTIVSQLQQCNNSQPGGYELRFNNIGYTLE
jgi:hypothetical protein